MRDRARHGLLIVDDEPQVLAALKDLLEDEFRVDLVSSPIRALARLGADPDISVIISDQRMPAMSGDEFLARARALSEATRLLITGYADLDAMVRAINEGKVFGYIAKPWDPKSIVPMIHEAVAHCEVTRALQQERALLNNLLGALPDAISFKDDSRAYMRVNGTKAAALGVGDPSDAVGRTDAAFHDRAQATRIEREEDEVFLHGRPIVDRIVSMAAADGSARWYSSTKAPIVDPGGKVVSLVCVARDITEREEARQALAESERRHRSLYNRTPVMMQSTDGEGRLIAVSDQWCETLGYRRNDVLGRPATLVMTAAGRGTYTQDILTRLSRADRATAMGCQLVSSAGREFDTLLSALVERDAEGRFLRHLFVIVDITEQKTLQAQLLQAQKMEAVGQLAGGIAHDFNNLLMVIIGNLDLGDQPMSPSVRQAIDSAMLAADRGAALTQRLLAFSRMQVLNPAAFDLNRLVAGLEDMLRRTLGATVTIKTRLQGDLWSTLADKGQVENALLNLAINARDAMADGGTLTIETANIRLGDDSALRNADLESGDYVMLAMTDTGAGMPQAVIERAVEPFFTTKEPGQGTGLGLSMVYGFVRQSGGHLKVESTVGHGTTVRVYLRRAQVEEVPIEANSAEASVMPHGSETILVVDDDPDVRRLVVRQIGSLGYRILEASDGASALEVLDGPEPIDLMFSDVVMPGAVTARQLGDAAREKRAGLRVLFTSGHAQSTMINQGRLAPGSQVLSKPYKKRDLALKLREIIDGAA